MTREPAQAGDRASKTGPYLQWWDTELECNAGDSVNSKLHHDTFYFVFARHFLQYLGIDAMSIPKVFLFNINAKMKKTFHAIVKKGASTKYLA